MLSKDNKKGFGERLSKLGCELLRKGRGSLGDSESKKGVNR